MAGDLGARADVAGVERRGRGRREVLRARDAAVPVGRAAHGPPEELLRRRRRRAFPPPQRQARPAPDGLRRVRAARREPRDQDRGASPRFDREVDRAVPAPVPRVGHLDRLVARVRNPRAALLPLDPVAVPAPAGARAGVPQGGGGQLVPERRDRAGQRAGDRRALRALRLGRGGAPARAVVLPHHRLRRPPARRPRHDRLAGARRQDAAQLDRPLRGRGGHVHLRGPGDRLPGLHHAPGHAVRRDVLRHGARAPRRAAAGGRDGARGRGARVRQQDADGEPGGPRLRRAREDRRAAGAERHQPGQRRAHPDVGRRLRADGVRHRRADGRAGARRARLRVREEVRPGDPPCRRGRRRAAVHRRRHDRQLGPAVQRDAQPRGARRDRRLARPRGTGPSLGQLPPAGLAALPAALLGLPDSGGALRRVRDRAGPRRPAAGDPARRHGLQAEGPLPARRGRGLGQHDLSEVRSAGAAGDRHDGHVRRLVVVLPALLRRQQRRGGVGSGGPRAVGAGRPVHRRRRARDPAPHVRALLREGVRGHGPPRCRRSRSRRSSRRA